MHEHEGIEYGRSLLSDTAGPGYAVHRLTCPGCRASVRLTCDVVSEVVLAMVAVVVPPPAAQVVSSDGAVFQVHEESFAHLSLDSYRGAWVHLVLFEGQVIGAHPV